MWQWVISSFYDFCCFRRVKSKVHYASWSETCSLARASEQVLDSFVGVYDKLTSFSGRKTCLGQDSAITTCRDSASRFVTGSLSFCRDSQMDFRKRPDVRTCSTPLWCTIYLFFVRTLCTSSITSIFPDFIIVNFVIVCVDIKYRTKFDWRYYQDWKFN